MIYETVVQCLSLLHNLIQICLNSDSAYVQILLAVCPGFVLVRISNNSPDWTFLASQPYHKINLALSSSKIDTFNFKWLL